MKKHMWTLYILDDIC